MATGVHKAKWRGDVITVDRVDDLSRVVADSTLTYRGKLAEEDVVLHTSPAELVDVWRGCADTNRLYFGDNLPVLARLLEESEIRGQVKLVYIDPPFATNKVYKSRKQVEAYCDTLMGAQYIEFLRRRLILLHRLLADDGSIYVHLDQTMVFYVKVMMDEIFGAQNFRNLITRQKCNPKNYTRNSYGNISDHILYYVKSDSPVWNRAYIPWSEERADEEYPYVEEITGRRYKKVPIHAPGTRNGATGQPWRDMKPPPGKHWQYTPDKLDALDARGEIYWSPTGNPRRKVYFDQSQGIPVQDIWMDVKDAYNQMVKITGYPTEKNPDLLTRIVEASSRPGDLVLDCFAGSGTTLAVASRLGRRWIGMDNSSEAIMTILKRFAQGLNPMGDFVNEAPAPSILPLFDGTDVSGEAESAPDAGSYLEERKPDYTGVIDDFTLYSVVSHSDWLAETLDSHVIDILEATSNGHQ